MALKAVPGYNPRGYVYGGASLPVAKAIVKASTPKIPAFSLPSASEIAAGKGVDIWGNPLSTSTAPGSSSGGGVTAPPGSAPKITLPGYNTELTSDFAYAPTEEAYNQAVTGARQSLRDQIRQAVIQSGYGSQILGKAPTSLQQYLSDLDPATVATADTNQLSDRAQLQKQLDTGMTDLAYRLAARGTGRSGALAAGAGALDQSYQVASDQQMRDLLNAISGGASQYTGLAANALAQRNAALQQIADRLSRLPGATYDTPTDTPTDTGGTDTSTSAPATSNGVPITPADLPWLSGISDAQKAAISGSTKPAVSGVNWGGQQFYTQYALKQYLGKNWQTWAKQHPDAWARLQP